jgi:Lectin C-type domain
MVNHSTLSEKFIDLNVFPAFNEPPNTLMMAKDYYLTTFFKANWIGAFNFCKSNGMELVNFRNAAEAQHFAQLFNVKGTTGELIYVDGITNEIGSGEWRHFGTGLMISEDFPWALNQPNNHLKEHCLVIRGNSPEDTNIFWDFDCTDLYPFVCQQIVQLTPPVGF